MRMYDIIHKKRCGLALDEAEIRFFVEGYTRGDIPDYQASALCMAICCRGMTSEETAVLTDAIMRSGDVVDLSMFGDLSVDKHSTGGVGDKTSLIVAPVVASLGGKMAKMSGRGLGHTGGTVDKLQSIPGYKTSLEKDEFMLLSYNEKVIPIDIEREKLEYCRTLVYWLNWTNRSKKYTLYNDVIERSLLVLKLMSYYKGAVLAALTTSLPETVGDVRNWDYRFCWLRDASMSIETMFRVGHAGAARRFMKFIQSTFVANRRSYQIMYGIRGERKLTEVILEHLSGYKDSRPVRIGNDAYHQRQNDSFGYLMDLIYQYYRLMPGTLDEIEDMWEMVKSILDTVQEDWQKPDKGIWEIRGESRHFVSSKVMCWVALDRGVKIARMLGKYGDSERWMQEADNIRQDVMEHGWKEKMQSFSQAYDNEALDSSLLLMEPYGFIQADDIRYHKTVEAVRKALFYKGLMYRYNSEDDFGMPSSAFTICTFWLIRGLFVTGRREEARCLFDEVLKYANHLGLFSEDIDFNTKEQLGNFPQAYSHLALVNTAILFAEEDRSLSFIRP